jgi:hypothetical protein
MPFVAALPRRKSENPKHGPRVASFAACPAGRCHGVLSIDAAGKPTDRYAVTRFPCDLAGAGYRCVKTTAGTDPEADAYDVFLSDRGDRDTCDCRGFLRWGHCRHVDGLRAVIDLGALWLPEFDDVADVSNTEIDDWAGRVESVYEDAWGNTCQNVH